MMIGVFYEGYRSPICICIKLIGTSVTPLEAFYDEVGSPSILGNDDRSVLA
jgi:hypothetical protein